MTYTDLLNIAGMMLSLDGWVLAAYTFFAALIAAAMGLKTKSGEFFFLWFLGLILAFLGPAYAEIVVEARFPYVFIFCFGIVGVGLAFLGFLAICFAPSIFAFQFKTKGRRLLLVANLAMVFPFGPVILFYFALRDYKKSLATIPGASASQASVNQSADVQDPKPAVEIIDFRRPKPVVETAGSSDPEPAVETAGSSEPEPAIETASSSDPETTVGTTRSSDPEPAIETAGSPDPETAVGTAGSSDPETTVGPSGSQDPEAAVESTDSPDAKTAVEAVDSPDRKTDGESADS